MFSKESGNETPDKIAEFNMIIMLQEKKEQQVAQIKAAIDKVVAVGPDFLSNKIPAEKMAHTMINAVRDYVKQAEEENNLRPQSGEAEELQGVLQELNGCGSGFLAQRCDAACVARTITYVLGEFSDPAKV